MNEQDKQTNLVLTEVSRLVKQGAITREQVLAVLPPAQPPRPTKDHINVQKVLYYIGGFILLLGIVFFFSQYWNTMGYWQRTILSLGSAIAVYALGYFFFEREKTKDIGQAFLLISIILFPLGIGTGLHTIGVQATTSGGISVNAAILFVIFFASQYGLKANIFLPFAFMAAATLFFSLTNFLTHDTLPSHSYEYRSLILGTSFVIFGYYYWFTEKKFMTNLLYFFGLAMILGSTLILQNVSPNANLVWEALYPFLLIGAFYASIRLQSSMFLFMATIFTFAEVSKITYEYFSKSIGWPVALMLAGITMMVIGYLSFSIRKQFLRPAN